MRKLDVDILTDGSLMAAGMMSIRSAPVLLDPMIGSPLISSPTTEK